MTHRRRFVGLALATIAMIVPPALAQEWRPGFQILDVVIDEPLFDEICTLAGLSAAARAELAPSHAGYLDATQAIEAEARAMSDRWLTALRQFRTLAAAGAAPAHLDGVDPADLPRCIAAAARTREPGPPLAPAARPRVEAAILAQWRTGQSRARIHADELRERWLHAFEATLPDRAADQIMVDVRRRLIVACLLLRPTVGVWHDFSRLCAADDLITAGLAPDSELHRLLDALPSDERAAAEAAIRRIGVEFEATGAALLRERMAYLRGRMDTLPRLGPRWMEAFDLAADAVDDVIAERLEDRAPALALELELAWRGRVRRIQAPDLFAWRWLDDLQPWAESHLDLTPERRADLADLNARYRADRAALRDAAFTHGRRLQRSGDRLSDTMSKRVRLAYADAVMQENLRGVAAILELCGMMTDAEFARCYPEIRDGVVHGAILCGPEIIHGSLLAEHRSDRGDWRSILVRRLDDAAEARLARTIARPPDVRPSDRRPPDP